MKKILLVVFLFFTLGMQSQEKYAVLIVGDYAAKLSDIPAEALWNGGEDLKAPMMEFWNDTYLMWELLKSKGYTDENIFILFADGNDFESSSSRYTPPIGVKLTDYAANRENVVNLFENLYNGTDGLPEISDDDFLFVWTFGHGNKDNNGVYSLCLVDGFLQDSIFSPLINAIPANRKAVWMQQCFGGGFANTLQSDNLVFNSASQGNQPAYRADDCTNTNQGYIENEIIDGKKYYHGEFNYHVISANKGLSPSYQDNYNGILYSTADLNNDNIISFYETSVWEEARESIDKLHGEEPLYSDLGNIGYFTSLQYPTLLYDTVFTDTEVRGIVGVTKDLIVESGILTFYGNSDVTILDSVNIIIKENAALVIDGNVNITGNNSSIIIEGKFMQTNNSSLTLNNVDINTNSTISLNGIEFKNSTISAMTSSSKHGQNSISVSGCTFTNPTKTFCININGYNSYSIDNNIINSCDGTGVRVYYSGRNLTDLSSDIVGNTITNCSGDGLLLYSSVAKICMNNINNNDGTGIKLLNNSTILQLLGNPNLPPSETQKIEENGVYEIFMTTSCIPSNFHYNRIYDDDNYPFIYYDSQLGNTSSGQQIYQSHIDVTYNNWKEITNPSNYLYSYTPNTSYSWNPIWNGGRSTRTINMDSLDELVNNYIEEKDFVKLKSVCKSIVDNYPETTCAENALKLLFNIEEFVDNDYNSLKSYYLTNSIIQSRYALAHLASYLANKCDEELGNWQNSIAWYQNMINDPNSSYNDSLFASIDLEYVYQRFGIRSSNDWQSSTDLLLSSLPHNKHYNSSETSWTEIVTSQPEGFVVNQDGNVTITNGEGLAWMISTVNGLNGQESNDYKDVVITLENDIYISGNAWVAIGTQENPFRGTFDGQGFSVQGIDMYDAYEGRNFGLFGYLDNAVIKNVTLGKGHIVGYEDCGGIAYKADNNTLIDRCVVRTEMSFCNNSGGIVGINKDSRISNCALIPESFEGAMMCVGGIAGQNISTVSDAIIENCFVSTEYVTSYSTSYAGGIAGKNITENEGKNAIIRNCYAAPLKMYGHSGGVAAYNSKNSVIENSYYTISYGSNDYILCEENEGEITNSTLFNEDLLLEENVEVYGEGVGELLEALNKWVENSKGQYNSWCVLEDENYGYPILEFMAKDFANMEELTIDNMVIYPNPAHEYIKIESEKKSEIKVYSVNGQIVLKRNINEGVSTIDISNLNSGLYFIDVDGNISKFVVR